MPTLLGGYRPAPIACHYEAVSTAVTVWVAWLLEVC